MHITSFNNHKQRWLGEGLQLETEQLQALGLEQGNNATSISPLQDRDALAIFQVDQEVVYKLREVGLYLGAIREYVLLMQELELRAQKREVEHEEHVHTLQERVTASHAQAEEAARRQHPTLHCM